MRNYPLLENYGDYLNEICPGIKLHPTSSYGLMMAYEMRLQTNEVLAVSDEHAKEIIKAIAEQIRRRAAYDLGLRPVMDGYDREIDTLRRRVATLEANNASLAGRVVSLEAVIEEMETSNND